VEAPELRGKRSLCTRLRISPPRIGRSGCQLVIIPVQARDGWAGREAPFVSIFSTVIGVFLRGVVIHAQHTLYLPAGRLSGAAESTSLSQQASWLALS